MQQNCIYICRMKTFTSTLLDRLGMGSALACAVHCALLPFLAGFLPLIGWGFLSGSVVEFFMLSLSFILGSISLGSSWFTHRQWKPFIFFLMGLLFIFAGHLIWHEDESWFVALGGMLLALAHYFNLQLLRKKAACPTHSSS